MLFGHYILNIAQPEAIQADIEAVQVHLSPAGTNSLNVMWATGSYKVHLMLIRRLSIVRT